MFRYIQVGQKAAYGWIVESALLAKGFIQRPGPDGGGGKFQIDQGPGFGIQAANATLEQRDFQGFEAPDMGQIDGWEGLQRRPTHDDTSRVMVKRAERAVGDSPGYLMWVRQASCCV